MKVVDIKEKRISHQAIRSLEYMLQRARNGELTDYCYVARVKGKWMYKTSTPENEHTRLSMLGMLESVKLRMALMLDWSKV